MKRRSARLNLYCKIIGVFCLSWVLPPLVEAQGTQFSQPPGNLSQMLKEQLEVIDQALEESDIEAGVNANTAIPVEIQDYLYPQNFWLRARLPMGFSVPGLVSLQVVPEVEFLIRRAIPDGWQAYRPRDTVRHEL